MKKPDIVCSSSHVESQLKDELLLSEGLADFGAYWYLRSPRRDWHTTKPGQMQTFVFEAPVKMVNSNGTFTISKLLEGIV